MQADVTQDEKSEERVNEVVEKTIGTFGRIDVLINNAQASASGILLSMQSKDHFDLGIFRACTCVLGSPDFKYMSGETLTLQGALGQRP